MKHLARLKHMVTRFYYVMDLAENGKAKLGRVDTVDMIAAYLTKQFASKDFSVSITRAKLFSSGSCERMLSDIYWVFRSGTNLAI